MDKQMDLFGAPAPASAPPRAPEISPCGREWIPKPPFTILTRPTGHRWEHPGPAREAILGDGDTTCEPDGRWIGQVCIGPRRWLPSPPWATEALAQVWVEGESARVLRTGGARA